MRPVDGLSSTMDSRCLASKSQIVEGAAFPLRLQQGVFQNSKLRSKSANSSVMQHARSVIGSVCILRVGGTAGWASTARLLQRGTAPWLAEQGNAI